MTLPISGDDLKRLIHLRKEYKVNFAGVQIACLCPFHEEKTPSFTMNWMKSTYHCFSCNKKGVLNDEFFASLKGDYAVTGDYSDALPHGTTPLPSAPPPLKERFQRLALKKALRLISLSMSNLSLKLIPLMKNRELPF